ncbi:MAG: PAS domain S-box protein [Bacillaceae bacterium]|nr:PAS domain S-box protein [Bacillaceae bacterium]
MNRYYSEVVRRLLGIQENESPPKTFNGMFAVLLLLAVIQLVLIFIKPEWRVPESIHRSIHLLFSNYVVIVSFLVFILGWNSDHKKPDRNLSILAGAYLGAGLINLVNLLAGQGIPMFAILDREWQNFVYESASLLLIQIALLLVAVLPLQPHSFRRRIYLTAVLVFTGGVIGAGLGNAWFQIETGETAIQSVMTILLSVTAVFLYHRYRGSRPFERGYLLAVVLFGMLSQISFIYSVAEDDIFRGTGYIYQMIASALILQGVIYENMLKPFRRLQKSEQILSKSKNWLTSILKSVYDGVVITDRNGKITFMNRNAEKITGWTWPEASGQSVMKVFQVTEGEHPVSKVMQDVNESGFISEVKIRDRTGRERYIQSSATLIRENQEEQTGVIFIFRDITVRKKTEEKTQRLIAILEATSDYVATMDASGRILYLNKAAREFLGVSGSEGLSINDISYIFSETERENILKTGLGEAAQKGVWKGETVFFNRDGQKIPVSQVIIAHPGTTGDVAYYSTIARDIRDLKEAEERLLFSATVYDNISEGVLITDKHNKILSVNPAFTRITGYREEEVIGEDPGVLSSGKHDRNFYEKMWSEVMSEGKWKGEIWNRHRDGTLFLEEISIKAIYDDQGNIIHYVGLFKDITEQKKTEELLKKSDRLAVAGQLAAGIAHEIRNPLTSIRGFIQFMQMNSEKENQYFDIILTELDRINEIVSELLVLARPQAVHFQKHDMKVLIEEVVTLFQSHAVLNNVQIISRIEPGLPGVYCEKNQLKQVLINLLKNALESMPDGGKVSIDASVRGDELRVRITDEGVGIKKEHLPRLGEPFYSTKADGTGLGLMISQKIIEDHHGRIEISSEEGKGTTVDVVLPLSTSLEKSTENRGARLE